MVRAVYLHFCTLLIEIIHARAAAPDELAALSRPEGRPQLVDALLSGRPLLIVTATSANWEMGGYVRGVLASRRSHRPRTGQPVLDIPPRVREPPARKVVAKKGDSTRCSRSWRGRRPGDARRPGRRRQGAVVDYFNRPASTHKAWR